AFTPLTSFFSSLAICELEPRPRSPTRRRTNGLSHESKGVSKRLSMSFLFTLGPKPATSILRCTILYAKLFHFTFDCRKRLSRYSVSNSEPSLFSSPSPSVLRVLMLHKRPPIRNVEGSERFLISVLTCCCCCSESSSNSSN